MLFNSYVFILVFLPLALLGYFVLNHFRQYQAAEIFLIGMSLLFYGWYNPKYLFVIILSVLSNYGIAYVINNSDHQVLKNMMLAVGVVANASSIFYFKYFNFFLENVNTVFSTSFELKNIVLPLGISFFTFQQISYLVDTWRGQTKDYGFIEYALFVVYFPQLIAGPIVLHKETIPQFRDLNKRTLNYSNLAKGLYIFSIGLFKKVIIADTFSKAVSWGFGDVWTLSSIDALLVSLSYTFQLYFDFSGYCDMAIGIGDMFNIALPQNFNSPYRATSIPDFWNRWHMSLTGFLREYVYFPLGGSKKGPARTYINIMIVFLVSGIWHGAHWTFIIWGLLHGILNCLNRMCMGLWNKLHVVCQWFITFNIVNLLWVIFRADGFRDAMAIITRILRFNLSAPSIELVRAFELPEFLLFQQSIPAMNAICNFVSYPDMLLFIVGAFIAVLNAKNSFQIEFKPSILRGSLTVLLLVWSIMSLAGVSEFLYFGF